MSEPALCNCTARTAVIATIDERRQDPPESKLVHSIIQCIPLLYRGTELSPLYRSYLKAPIIQSSKALDGKRIRGQATPAATLYPRNVIT